jgi:FKBP-type peptidyl-prolyl cis-trans isomerase FkpA
MMKPALLASILFLLPACNQMRGSSNVSLNSDDDKAFYALGVNIGRNLARFSLTPNELDIVKAGLSDAALGKKSRVEIETYGPKLNQLMQKRSTQKTGEEKKKGEEAAAKAGQEPGAEKSASGLVYKSISEGTGASPKASDTVRVHYKGTLLDGTEFDSSYKRGQPAEFPLGGVIPCWTEGVQKMKVGGKAKLVCPSSIAYGDQGRPGIPPGATLFFEVELVAIVENKAAPMTPVPPTPTPAPPGAKVPPPAGKKTEKKPQY